MSIQLTDLKHVTHLHFERLNRLRDNYVLVAWEGMGSLSTTDKPQAVTSEGFENCNSAGPYFVWGEIGSSPVTSVGNFLARRKGTDNFFIIKILFNIEDNSEMGLQGKNLMHTEFTILKILADEEGVVQVHGLFKDVAKATDGKIYFRLCLVLDCYYPHEFSPDHMMLTTLQDHVCQKLRLSEKEALTLFFKILLIVQRLHQKNIVHHDLKLSNIILNKDTGAIKIINFCLGKQLAHEDDLLTDTRGSPAYAAPELMQGEPYTGKPVDMWALGVIFYTLLYGHFPFYSDQPKALFKLIKEGDYKIPASSTVSENSVNLIKAMLVVDPKARITCDGAIEEMTIKFYQTFQNEEDDTELVATTPQISHL